MNIVVFDLETKARPGSDCTWEEKHKMGISVGVSFSFQTGDFTTYLDDNMGDLWEALIKADLVTGYNILSFDLPLLKAEMENWIHRLTAQHQMEEEAAKMLAGLEAQYAKVLLKSYDMYPEAKAGAGADTYDKGYRVDDLLRATWGAAAGKTGNGAFAPDLFKAGKQGELISYCIADVQRERRLFERCWTMGTLRAAGYKEGKEYFTVKRPQEMLGLAFFTPLPYPIDGDPCGAPPPEAPYIPVVQEQLASDSI